jgi:FMN-dependent NADH-azoreductase
MLIKINAIQTTRSKERPMKLLQVDSSPMAAQSVSRQLTRAITAQWLAAHPGTTVEVLDLAREAPSHLDQDSLGFRLGLDDASLTDAQRRENAVSERLVSQFLAADVIVVGAPMYNFSVPSQLKAWIDRLAQAGRTFRYTEKGPVGLAGGKTVIVASSRGGVYSSNPALAGLDHQESYLKTVFGFMGIDDVRFVRAEGVGMGEAARAQALAAAGRDIRAHVTAANQERVELAA